MHPRRPEEDPPNKGNRDRGEHEHREDINRPGEQGAACAWHVEAEDAIREKVDRSDRDDEEAPEDESVRQPADVVRPFQELPLTEVDDEFIADTPPRMVDSSFVAA